MAEKIYTVTGMSCAACANAVEKALNKKRILMLRLILQLKN